MQEPDAAVEEIRSIIRANRDELTEIVSASIEERVPFYSTRVDDSKKGELRRSVGLTVDTFLSMKDSHGRDLASSALLEVNRERSITGVPLDVIHRTWHVATRGVWMWLADVKQERGPEFAAAVDTVWEEWLAFVDSYIPLVTDLYLRAQQTATQSETIAMNMALDHLLESGTEAETKSTLRWLFFRSDRLVLGLFEFEPDQTDGVHTRIREFATILANAGSETNVRSLWTVHAGRIVVVFDAHPRNIVNVRKAITKLPIGVSGGLSHISGPHVRLSALHRQASIALRAAPWGGLVELKSLSLVTLVAANVTLAWSDLPQDVQDFFNDDLNYDGEWLATARALWTASMNARTAAENLHVHPNTIYYRLATIQNKCGIDLRDPEVLMGIKFVHEALELGTLTREDVSAEQ